jgi:hypothetical protein
MRKAIDILKHDGHLMFGGQEIQKGICDKDTEVVYQKLMSPSNNMSKMSLFFFVIHIKVIEDMVRKDTALF